MMSEQVYSEELLKALPNRIKTRRRDLGLTQEQLAERAGLSVNYIARLELGSKRPSLATTVRLAGALGVRPSDLVADEENERWLDEAQDLAHALGSLRKAEAEFVINQFRATVEFLRRQSSDL